MSTRDEAVAANLASLNEIMAEVVQALADMNVAGQAFADLTRSTLRDHSWALGFEFQGERGEPSDGPYVDERPDLGSVPLMPGAGS